MRKSIVYAACLWCAAFFPRAAEAQNFKPFSELRTIKTEYFEFIFPPESKETARLLADTADDTYRRLRARFGIGLSGRTPVSITPHTGESNGYMNPVPYSHILLFDTPEFPDFSVFENSIQGLFIHELTHAVTAGSRGPAMRVLHGIFGGWANLLALNAPWFIIEGTAVAVESEGGYGRGNDPLIKGRLRQDIIEGAFKTPFQAEGVWDLPPAGNVYYDYGGLFCMYLIRRYGDEKFGELWRLIGRTLHLSIVKYNNGFYYIFKKIYGRHILEAWEDFKHDIALGREARESEVVFREAGSRSGIADAVSKNGNIYFIDTYAQKARMYDAAARKAKTVLALDAAAYALDASPDGSRLLVSTYRRRGAIPGQLSRPVAVEYRIRTGLPTGRVFKDLFHARYFRDGVIGIAADTHKTNVVYRPFRGAEELLLKGSAELTYGNLSPLDDGRFAFICAERGEREIAVFDYEAKRAATFAAAGGAPGRDGAWQYARALRWSEGRLLFQHDDNDGMYKLGEIRFDGADGPYALFHRLEFSGAVHNPVMAGGTVYHKSAFSQTDALSRYPAPEPPGGGGPRRVPLALRAWDAPRLAVCGLLPPPPPPAESPLGAGGIAMSRWEQYGPFRFMGTPPRYLNPLKLWLPLPYVAQSGVSSFEVNGAGGFFYISDPFDSNLIFLRVYYDWKYKILPVDLMWINYTFGIPIYIYYEDYVFDSRYTSYRFVMPRAYFYFSFPLYAGLRLDLRPGVQATYRFGGADAGEGSAYGWEKNGDDSYFFNMDIILTTMRRRDWQVFGNGLSGGLYIHAYLPGAVPPAFESVLAAAAEPLPFLRVSGIRQTLYAVWWDRPLMDIQGRSMLLGTRFEDAALAEYALEIPMDERRLNWLAGGQTEAKLFGAEAQNSLSHVYLNRVFSTLAWRWAYWGGQLGGGYPSFLHSAVLRLGMDYSAVPVTVLPLKIRPLFWFALKLSALSGAVDEKPFAFGFNVTTNY